jgi:hypothetical protein
MDNKLIDKGSCPKCGSSDANAHYSDGQQHRNITQMLKLMGV